MSNQIFSNERTKYYDYPGLNNYLISGDITNILTAGSVDIAFDVDNILNDSTIIDNGLSNSVVLRDGMYSFMLVIGVLASSSPTADSLENTLSLLLTRAGQFTALTLQVSRSRYIPNGATASASMLVSLSGTFYCKAGDIITYRFQNNGPATCLITASNTTLTVNKIY
jgi:hypothetical protein